MGPCSWTVAFIAAAYTFSNAARRVLIAIKEPPLFPRDNPPPKDSDILLALGRRPRQARLRIGVPQNALAH